MRRSVVRSVRPWALAIGLVLAVGATSGCQQARSTWCGTRDAVQAVFENPCCPDPCGNVYSTPVYGGGCGGGQGEPVQTYGAFARQPKVP